MWKPGIIVDDAKDSLYFFNIIKPKFPVTIAQFLFFTVTLMKTPLRSLSTLLFLILVFPTISVFAQEQTSTPDDETILEWFEGLRVADVSDGMDMVGLRDVGLMDTRIEPLWRDIENFNHIVRGIALTVRYVPTNHPANNPNTYEEFDQWVSDWYGELSPEPFVELIKPGSIIVIDASGDGDTGSVGSNNSLSWVSRGAKGIVSNGSVRDTDEIIKQEIPVYLDLENRGRGIRPGRNEIESVNQPVEVGGVLVRPGDVIVADGDGVIVVPREFAEPVSQAARKILESDKAARRSLYERLGRPLDHTVQ